MGASASRTSVDVVNQSIIDIVTQNVNDCSTSANVTQNVDFSGVGVFSSANQTMTLSTQCLQNIKVDNNMLTQMANKIQQEASANAIALLPSFSGSENRTNLTNYLSSKISTSSVQKCATSALQSQNVAFSGVQIGSRASQTVNIFTKCMQESLNQNAVAQGVVIDTQQKASSTTSNPLDFIAGLFSIYIYVFLFIIVVAAAYLLWPAEPDTPAVNRTTIAEF